MPSQQDRSDKTRANLCAAFRESLLTNGVTATTTDRVLAVTGLSKGAMYHHFRSKAEIIEAVYRAESHGAMSRAVASVAPDSSAVDRLKRACTAWLEELQNPDVARILLDIGPAALGLKRVTEIENELSLALIEGLLVEAVGKGQLELARPALAARLINALMGQVAIQRGADRAAAVRVIAVAIDAILAALAEP